MLRDVWRQEGEKTVYLVQRLERSDEKGYLPMDVVK